MPTYRARAFLIAFVTLTAAPLSAQQPLCGFTELLPLDSMTQVLPPHTIRLGQTWRMRIGDDPAWSAPGFDDSGWATTPIDAPLSDTMRVIVQNMERSGRHGVIWMRRTMKFSETTACRAFVIMRPAGPGDVYVNGRLVLTSGDVNQKARGASARVYQAPFEITLPAGPVIVAVRVNLAAAYDVRPKPVPVFTAFAGKPLYAESVRDWAIIGACAGVLVAFGLLHFFLFFALRKQRENLYFALFALSIGAALGCVLSAVSISDVRTNYTVSSMVTWFIIVAMICLIFFLCGLRKRPASRFIKVVATLWFVDFALNMIPGTGWGPKWYIEGIGYVGLILILLVFAELLRVMFLGVRERAPGVLITLLGMTPTFLVLLSILPGISNLPIWALYATILAPAIAASVFLVRNIAKTSQGLERLSASLKDEVAAQTVELREARIIAEEANRAKSDFLANMSHELRTPLNAIIGYSEMLVDESRDTGNESIIPDLERVHSSGKHLLGLINDVLDLSKVESGKMELVIEEFDVAILISQVSATIQPLLNKNHNELVCDVSAWAGTMCNDEVKVRQILFNLLSNASKFTSNGSIVLSVTRVDDDVMFAVKDSGIGMTEAQLAKLFQPFTQAETTTSRKYGGTGLGLTISKRFAELMGGAIEVTSEHGVGTTFTLRIPAAAPGFELAAV